MAYDFSFLNVPNDLWQQLWRKVVAVFDPSTGHDHDGSNSRAASQFQDVTAGVATASKAAILGATKNLDTLLLDAATAAAAGTNQATATALTADTTTVTGADNTKGVKLPTAVAGRRVLVANTDATYVLKLYPASGGTINALAQDAALTVPQVGLVVCLATSATQWWAFAIPAGITAEAAELNLADTSQPLGVVAANKLVNVGATKNLDTLLFDVAAPAAAGSAQGDATAMTADTNLVTAADGTTGVKLPTAVAGRRLLVKNTVETQILKVYPATGAAINALGANVAISLPAGGLALFLASSATQWYTTAVPDGITATAAEINAAADEQALTASTGGWTAKRFVGADLQAAGVSSTTVLGVSPGAVAEASAGPVQSFGCHAVVADAPLTAGDAAKVGVGSRATKHTTAQTTVQAAATGEIASFTQPVGATTLEILQAVDVEADRARGVVIVGGNAGGAFITETILLDATNTTTPVAGATSFTTISAVYTANGAVLGAQNVTVRASGAGATVCTLVGATSELGADIPSGTIQGYCNKATVAAAVQNATYITLVGYDSTDALTGERAQLDNATPSKVTTTKVWRTIERICLGELTAIAVSVKTNETTDTAAMKCGVVVVTAAARGDDAVVLVKPNA